MPETPLPSRDELCEDVDELLSYAPDYFSEKWELPTKAERVKVALRSWVDREAIDYEAAALRRHMYGRPKCYEDWDADECYCRAQTALDVDAALGGDDE